MPSILPPAQAREARLALAMLPVGGTVLVTSALAFVAVAAMALDLILHARFGWPLAWSVATGVAAAANARAGIEVMSAFDWRPLPQVAIVSALVIAGWLALPPSA